MSQTMLLTLLMATPLVISLLAFACRLAGGGAKGVVTLVHTTGISLMLVFSLWMVYTISAEGDLLMANRWIHLDSLAGLFLAILGIVGFLTGLYSIGYMNHEVNDGEVSVATLCNYYGFFHLFLFTMLLVITSNNLILMWAAVEATTLSSAFWWVSTDSALPWKRRGNTSSSVVWVWHSVCSVPSSCMRMRRV